jgi:hypothetical protein
MRTLLLLGGVVVLLAAVEYGAAQDQPLKPNALQLPGGFQPPGVPAIRSGLDYKDVIPPLIDALKDSDTEVRRSAAGALANMGQPAVGPLVDVLKDKDKKDLHANVAYVLGQMGTLGQDAIPTLLKLLKDDDRDVRRRAAYAIQNIIKSSNEQGGMMPGAPGGGLGAPGTFPGGFGGGAGRGVGPGIRIPDPGVVPGADAPAAPVRSRGSDNKEEKPEKKENNQK